MRASSRRSQNSSGAPSGAPGAPGVGSGPLATSGGVKRPRSTSPRASNWASPRSTSSARRPQRAASAAAVVGAGDLAVAAQQTGAGLVAVGDGGGHTGRQAERRVDPRAGEEQLDQGQVLGGEPVAGRRAGQAAGGLRGGGAPARHEVVQPNLPSPRVGVGHGDEREEQVVHLLRVAGDGPGLLAHAGDGRGVQRGEVARVVG